MPNKSKAKGYRAEVAVVETFKRYGYPARRAWGSNGKAFGWSEEVDVLTTIYGGDIGVQVKSRKKLPSYIMPSSKVHMQVIRQDRGELVAVIPLERLLLLLGGMETEISDLQKELSATKAGAER